MMKQELAANVKEAVLRLESLKKEIQKAVIGQDKMVSRLIMAILCSGHVLLEGVPGIAKTLAVNTLAKALDLDFKRIQFTPDLLPSDLIGTSVYHPKDGTFSVEKGPVFTNIVLADEINRAPPKVQSALLEVMQERQVTIGGETFKTKTPYFVLGTQNPIEQEGTYPLPEAETDRFMMKVVIEYPSASDEKEIVLRYGSGALVQITPQMGPEDIRKLQELVKAIYIDDKILEYIISIVTETRTATGDLEGLLEYGASPRASLWLASCSRAHALLNGRDYVTPFDVKEVAPDILRHRLVLSYEAQAREITPDEIIKRIFNKIAVP
ncbi:MAG: MoxR family ATPase [Verrucomicrobia bacterium]|nr:MoxR family ATPase [Verrucomicrobiota bacterium]MBS0637507.1 MoxR family ATPase [Verrucomicrobiota bacterium]